MRRSVQTRSTAGGNSAGFDISKFVSNWKRREGEATSPKTVFASLRDMEMEFMEEHGSIVTSSSSSESNIEDRSKEEGDDSDVEAVVTVEEKAAFWRRQYQYLQNALNRSGLFESRLRREVAAVLNDCKHVSCGCSRRNPVPDICRGCLRKHVVECLQVVGYNVALCKSKWRSSPDIPAGEHTFINVISKPRSGDRGESNVVIELDFRMEFNIARSCDEYEGLVALLPEVFVGKPERLKEVIKVVCSAAKCCMKEKKMHMGPWRKHKYMQAKWLGPYEKINNNMMPTSQDRVARPPEKIIRTNFFSFDLSDQSKLGSMASIVEVV